MMKKILLFTAFLSCFAFAKAQDHTVTLQGLTFTPADLTIRVGETVEWVNNDGTHNVNGSQDTYPDNPEGFFSGPAEEDPWTFLHTFTQRGFYNYQCDPHVDFDMVGSITVLPQECTIASITANNADGEPDSLGVTCEIQGIIHGINYRPGGLQFTVIDENNDGIGVFSSSNDFGYTVEEGDEVAIQGEVAFFNGLTQMNPDTVILISSGNALFDPTIVTVLDESAESQLVTLENVSLVDPGQWQSSGSFNVDVTDGTNTFAVRIDSDTDISGMGAPSGTFNITGIGGQFDSSAPYDEGYQLFPRYATDIDPYVIDTPDYPAYPIGTITTLDADGNPDSLGVQCQIQGLVYGLNLRSSGLQFTLIDDNNDGIAIFNFSEDFDYTVQEGDELILEGEVTFFNGLTQFEPASLEVVSSGNDLVAPTVVTALGEDTESQLVTIENVMVVDPGQWTNSGSGFNVDVTDGTNTYVIRIDAEVDIYNMGVPTGTFTVTGIGGQFDSSEPYDEGYQLLPRYAADIDPYDVEMPEYPAYPIGTISTVDANGNPDSLGVACEIQGVVYGINYRSSGLQFTIIDDNNDGIGLFSSSEDFGYMVQEGDEVIVRGEVGFFNGLTQMSPDTVILVSSDNALFDPTIVTALGEETESQLVTIENVTLVDPEQWESSGSFNVDITDGSGTFVVRIDSDTDISGMGAPTGTFNVTGLGGQFDSSEPYDEGYQLFPRYVADIDPYEIEVPQYPAYPIGTINTVDADGNPDSLGVVCEIQGVVYGVNLRGSGLQFTVIDDNNDGIGVFSSSADFGYTVQEGDEIILRGEVTFFNGLTQFGPDTLELVSSGNDLFDPTVVTALGEDTESQLVTIEDVMLVDPEQWTNSGSGFNVDVTDGTNTYVVRIDADVDIYGMGAPIGTFDVTGIGGQFDNEPPYLDGYQLLPRYVADIDPYDMEEVQYPQYTIGEVTTNDANGNPDSLGVTCELQGIVHGVNYRLSGGGLQFTLIDENNDGIHVFSNDTDLGYTVAEGDEIIVQGSIAFFSGLTEIVPVNVELLSSGNALFDPTVVSTLGEDTESQLVRINGLTLVDPGQWSNSGSAFNVDATDGTNTIEIRIDADTDVFGTEPPSGTFDIIGLGGQFDSSEPYDEGYQLFPRYMPDILEVSAIQPPVIPADIEIFPNPTRSLVQIRSLKGLEMVRVSNIYGQQMLNVAGPADNFELNLSDWANGVYIVTLYRNDQQWSTWVVKE